MDFKKLTRVVIHKVTVPESQNLYCLGLCLGLLQPCWGPSTHILVHYHLLHRKEGMWTDGSNSDEQIYSSYLSRCLGPHWQNPSLICQWKRNGIGARRQAGQDRLAHPDTRALCGCWCSPRACGPYPQHSVESGHHNRWGDHLTTGQTNSSSSASK